MTVLHAIYLVVGALVCVFLELLAISSLREDQLRAATISSTLFIFFALIWFGGYFVLSPPDTILTLFSVLAVVFFVLYFAPLGSNREIRIGSITERFDERDVIFSREEYLPETAEYIRYYAMKPEYKEIDDRMRKLPELLEPGGRFYDAEVSGRIDAVFRQIEKLTTAVDGETSGQCREIDAVAMTHTIKQMVRDLGADEVGIAVLNPMFVYSHVGRGPEKWSAPIINNHRFAVAFTVEMRYAAVSAAPLLPITEETADRYLRAARISIELADHIRALGYPARAHISGSNYQIILPPVAHDAGLGELGRHGYLISPKFGPRIRLGAVTTDLPLVADKPVSFGVQNFCARCLKCAVNCPAGAIPAAGKTEVRGVEKWPLNPEQCFHYWRVIGTDCGLCMKVCPYSHPPTFVHNAVRAAIRRSSFARRFSIWADDLLYGKKPPLPRP
ncbi:MAG: 4Fe-4S dicluster domain-containing protein [Candidatus Zixiibacteriota bacterium]|nr:MAG: 4Fe-4S dicluster domain-containing protein [candidate division Zixibacteria bacterium]